MATYSIPDDFIKGFERIITLPEQDLITLSKLIEGLEIAEPFDKLLERGKDQIKSISINELQLVIQSLVSIVTIFSDADDNIDDFTNDFSKSYLYSKPNSTEEESVILNSRLAILLKHFKNLTVTVKGRDLLTENQRNFRDGRIVSDIRILFNDNLRSEEKEALIVHNLKIQYTENRMPKDFFVALDLSDLKKLKLAVDRAIEKDKAIKLSHHKFNFLDFNNASDTNH